MENQTRFDLNAAIENWRNELAAQPNLASDDRRELETHLRDAIAGFQQRGLNDEESFWLARRRVGQPQQLGEEFVKADPAKVWRERVFWMVLAVLIVNFWLILITCIPLHGWTNGFWGLLSGYAYMLLCYLPILALAIIVAKGQLNERCDTLAAVIHSRWRFVTIGIFLIVGIYGTPAVIQYFNSPVGRPITSYILLNYFSYFGWPLMLLLLAAWLMPTKGRNAPKRA
ncbi:MAG TPA: permease prefix domain 1-containing protein [Verrucomicrobiae bacterium]|nr:permease prefix domain 1-containing protein [Verrucomicrobiae bacterium]